MDRYVISERFARMWRESREASGKSQEYMAKKLGVSKKTVQNWEDGTSCPNQAKGFEWFSVLGVQPMPYYLRLLYPINFEPGESADDQEVKEALNEIINNITPDMRKKLLYILGGTHGSSVVGIIEMVTAHLQSPLRDRLNVGYSILINYDLAKFANKLKRPDACQPNLKLLMKAIDKGREAIKRGQENYTTLLMEDDE